MASKWTKGMPSPNPRGRGAGRDFSSSVVSKARSAPGHDGVIAYAGYIQTGERNSKLSGTRLYLEYANAYQHPVVAIALLLRWALLVGVKWSLTPNSSGGDAAQRGVDVVEHGLLKARLAKPWNKIVAKAANEAYFEGFSLHAYGMGRRPDGLVAFTELEHRPPHTIEQWWRERGDMGPFVSVTQRTQSGQTATFDIDQCLYLVNDAIGDSPAGTGVLRLVLERLRRVGKYEGLEGREMFTNMGGTPVGRAPIEEIAAGAPGDADAKQAEVLSATQTLRDVIGERVKTPEEQPYLLLDSATYRGSNTDTISGAKKWDLEVVKGEVSGLPDIDRVITRETLNIARVLGVEFVLVGGGDIAGTFGMHESKVDMFADTLTAWLSDIARSAEQQLGRKLCVMNGLDPDEACPTFVPSPIKRADVLKAVQALSQLNMAGLPPNHPARKATYEAVDMPWQDEEEPMLPRMPRPLVQRLGDPASDPIDTEEPDPADVEDQQEGVPS